jgi:hypothetical protein
VDGVAQDEDPRDRFDEDLIGLDPADPEVREFAEHLDRMEKVPPGYTVEGYLTGVSDFANSANRASGELRLVAVLVVSLLLLGVLVAAWNTLGFVFGTLIR